jgi:hypothetical protein
MILISWRDILFVNLVGNPQAKQEIGILVGAIYLQAGS